MNPLLIASIVIGTTIVATIISNMNKEYKPQIKPWLYLVEGTLSWWSFGYGLFFVAPNKEAAWFWHRVSSVGWSTFAAFTAMYFIVYTGQEKKYSAYWKRVIFFGVPLVLLIRNLFGQGTSVAADLVMSTSGLGWTYVNDIRSPWYWFMLFQMIAYFTIAFVELDRYKMTAKFRVKKELAIGFIILDGIIVLLGILTDFILPTFCHFFPPMSVLGIGLFQFGYFGFIQHYDLCNIDNAISSEYILETIKSPIFCWMKRERFFDVTVRQQMRWVTAKRRFLEKN